MLGMLKDRRTGSGSKWSFCIAALALLAAPVPPPIAAIGHVATQPQTTAAPPASAVASEVKQPQYASSAKRQKVPVPQASPAAVFSVKGVLELNAPIGYGDYAWNDEAVPDGPVTVVVDLRAQRLYAYRGGIEIGRSSILYGADDKPTPTGVFPILQKKRDHVSNLYGAPMPYMMRLTMDGVAIHASDVEEGAATHGCIGVPLEFASLLFAEAQLGDKVLVTDAWKPEIYWKKGAWATSETA